MAQLAIPNNITDDVIRGLAAKITSDGILSKDQIKELNGEIGLDWDFEDLECFCRVVERYNGGIITVDAYIKAARTNMVAEMREYKKKRFVPLLCDDKCRSELTEEFGDLWPENRESYDELDDEEKDKIIYFLCDEVARFASSLYNEI